MPIKYDMSFDGELLRVRASGSEKSLEEAKEYGLALIAEAMRLGCQKILADERELDYGTSILDTFWLAKFYAENVPGGIMVATVHPRESGENARFWETATSNRGMVTKVFETIEEAERWLREG